jgi:hypothetical protein
MNPNLRYLDIPEYPGYKVGEDGSFWTLWIRGNQYRPRHLGRYWQYMRGTPCKGYYKVTLINESGSKIIPIHKLVLLAFIGPCPAGKEAAHEDGVKANNALTNLQYKTHLENIEDSRRHGTMVSRETAYNTKLSTQDVIEIIEDSETPQVQLAVQHGVSPQTISTIKRKELCTRIAST